MAVELLNGEPLALLVYDEPEPCPYLSGRTARMPMRLPLRPLSGRELDDRLAAGDRRHGHLLYRPSCPDCRACEAIRLDVTTFRPSRTMRRVKNRGDRALELRTGPPRYSDDRLALYEKHKRGRNLISGSGNPLGPEGYAAFLVERCVDAFEMRYFLDGQLVGVAVADRGREALSAVYCYFDPDHGKLSIGTYSILKQLELCQQWGLRHLYLGLYIRDNAHMSYKARFRPHERLVDGVWVPFC